jgi:hypothetical protein
MERLGVMTRIVDRYDEIGAWLGVSGERPSHSCCTCTELQEFIILVFSKVNV